MSDFVKAVIELDRINKRLQAIENGNDPEVNRKAAELAKSIDQDKLKRQIEELVNKYF